VWCKGEELSTSLDKAPHCMMRDSLWTGIFSFRSDFLYEKYWPSKGNLVGFYKEKADVALFQISIF
jgi:hypothetical protein